MTRKILTLLSYHSSNLSLIARETMRWIVQKTNFKILTLPFKIFWCVLYYKLGDSQNYMPPILVPSSAKCIATQTLIIGCCEHISNFVLIVDFEQAKRCLVQIEKTNTFINKLRLNLYHHNPTGESVRNFCEGVYFRRWFWLKRCSSHSKWPAVWTFVFLQILLARRLIRELIFSCCKLLLSC